MDGEGEIQIPGMEVNPLVRIGQLTSESRIIWQGCVPSYLIEDETQHARADVDLVEIQAQIKKVDGERTSLTKPLLDTKRRIDTLFEKPLAWLREAEGNVKRGIADYRSLRDAGIEQQKAESSRLLAESQKKVEDAILAGKPEEAAVAMTQQAELAVTVQAAAAPIKDINPSYTEWKYTVNDFMALVKAVSSGQVPMNFLQVNEGVLGKYVRDLKEHTPAIPGVTVFSEKTIRGKGGKK